MGRRHKGDAEYLNQFLFDTSVWIDLLHKKNTPQAALLSYCVENNYPVLLTPTIVQELLQGLRNDAQYEHIKDILSYYTVLQIPPVEAAIGAAELYRSLRKKGLTIRKSNDCLIAFHAIEFSIPLVHTDNDFEIIGKHTKLKIWKSPK